MITYAQGIVNIGSQFKLELLKDIGLICGVRTVQHTSIF